MSTQNVLDSLLSKSNSYTRIASMDYTFHNKNFPKLAEVRGQFQALAAFSIKNLIPFPIVWEAWLTSE